MWAFLTGLVAAIPSIDDIVKRITALFTKTPAQLTEDNASKVQADENNIDKTGRPL